MNCLLVTDNTLDEALLGQALRLVELKVTTVSDLRSSLTIWPERPADCIVIANQLQDPLATVREIRRVAVVPLIVIVDPIPEAIHLAMVDAGADWVIERPYSVRMLPSYVKALMRRTGTVIQESLPTLQHETISLNPSNRTVKVAGRQPQRLSQLEFRLLHSLMTHKGQVLLTETIVEHVWGYTGEGDRSLVRGLINRLRMKIEADPHTPTFIQTIPGVGYSFDE